MEGLFAIEMLAAAGFRCAETLELTQLLETAYEYAVDHVSPAMEAIFMLTMEKTILGMMETQTCVATVGNYQTKSESERL